MIKKKSLDIDNMDEFLSIELDKNISVGYLMDILDSEYKEFVSYFTKSVQKFINKKKHKLKREFLNTAKMLISNKDKLDVNIIDALFSYRLGYIISTIFKFVKKRGNLKNKYMFTSTQQMYATYDIHYNKHRGLLKEDFIKHIKLLSYSIFINRDINSLLELDTSIYTEIAVLSNVELEYNRIFQKIHKSLIGTNYNISIGANQEDEYDSYQLGKKVTKKINRLELFSKLYHDENCDKEQVVTLFKIIDTYGKNSNFFKMVENNSVVDKTKVDRLKKDIDTAISRAIVYNHIVTDVTKYRED